MLDSFNINITKLVKLPQLIIDNYPEEYGSATDIVTVVHYTLNGYKGGFGTSQIGMVHPPFDKEAEFVDYSKLTNEQVTTWVETLIGEEKLDQIKTEMEQELDSKLEDKLPWE